MLGKKVFIADIYGINTFSDSVKTKKGWVGFSFDSMYAALGNIKIIPGKESVILYNNSLTMKITLEMQENYRSFLQTYSDIQTELVAGVFNGKTLLKEYKTGITVQQVIKQNNSIDIQLTNLPKGGNEIRFGIRSKNYLPTHNSETIHIIGL